MRRESDTLRPGDRAPEFTLQDAYGTTYSLEDLLSGAGTEVPAYESTVTAGERRGAHDSRLLIVFDRGTW
jgi:peroxiredoxin